MDGIQGFPTTFRDDFDGTFMFGLLTAVVSYDSYNNCCNPRHYHN